MRACTDACMHGCMRVHAHACSRCACMQAVVDTSGVNNAVFVNGQPPPPQKMHCTYTMIPWRLVRRSEVYHSQC